MMNQQAEAFEQERARLNEHVRGLGSTVINRVYSVDGYAYEARHANGLDAVSKELLGLVASLVLRCDDCVRYHILAAHRAGATRRQLIETLEIGTVVGGTIIIPHLRRAASFLDEVSPAELND
jgi:AhpD family alkylhydroperoxidase